MRRSDPTATERASFAVARADAEPKVTVDNERPPLNDNNVIPVGSRPALPPDDVARIRAERMDPRWHQWDYLHLAALRDALADELRLHAVGQAPSLDLYCGAKPYEPLVAAKPLWGFDIDLHFGGADTVGGLPLPFASESFAQVICTQALHLVEDPQRVVAEMRRVLIPGGRVVVTVPHIFKRDLAYERKLGRGALTSLFDGWADVRVLAIGGPGTGAAYVLGKIASGVGRRWSWTGPFVRVAVLAINGLGAVADFVLAPLRRRYPALLMVVAARYAG